MDPLSKINGLIFGHTGEFRLETEIREKIREKINMARKSQVSLWTLKHNTHIVDTLIILYKIVSPWSDMSNEIAELMSDIQKINNLGRYNDIYTALENMVKTKPMREAFGINRTIPGETPDIYTIFINDKPLVEYNNIDSKTQEEISKVINKIHGEFLPPLNGLVNCRKYY